MVEVMEVIRLEGNVGKRVWRHPVACLDFQENYHLSVNNTKAAGGRGLQREWWSLAPQHMSRQTNAGCLTIFLHKRSINVFLI